MLSIFFFHADRFFDYYDWHVKNGERNIFSSIHVAFFVQWMMPVFFITIYWEEKQFDEKYSLHPVHEWQKRYEALRASFVDRLPAEVVADRFGYSQSYINLLRHQFIHEKISKRPDTDFCL